MATIGACIAPLGWIAHGGASAASAAATPAYWRADFPALQQRIDGQPLSYLDNAATTQRPRAVIEALVDFYSRDNANPGARLHTLARRAHERYEEARVTVARFIHANDPNEVVWVRGTTEAINLAASSWGRAELRRGDEILLTQSEHASNMLPWRMIGRQLGAAIRFVEVDDAGRISLDDLDRKLNARTRMVAFSHVSNVTGYINPAAEICARARRAGARVLIDAAQSVPHLAIDVQTLGCDFLAFSSHKVLGPMGAGVLWASQEMLGRMHPYQSGSNMAHDVDVDMEVLESGARKFGAGTPNASGPIGLAAAIRYLESIDRAKVERHESALTRHGLARLREVRGLTLLGPSEWQQRIPVFSFSMDQRAPLDVLRHLDSRGIAVRAGDLSALPLLKHFGVTAAVRASCYFYTQIEEIDRLAEALHEIADSG